MISGNLSDDARSVDSKTPGGDPFMAFTVCVNNKKGDTKTTDFIDVTSRVTGVLEHLKKGKKVTVYGVPEFGAHINKEGVAIANIRLKADRIELD